MPTQLKNYINGAFVASSATDFLDVIDPATEEIVAAQPVSTPDEVNEAVQAANTAFKSWKRTTPSQRQKILLDFADAIEANADALVEAQHRNTGQPKEIIKAEEVLVSADQVRFFAGAARRLDGIAAGEYAEGLTSYVRREPIGVCAQVTPWNYPLMMAIWKIAPAIAAGNTVVLKPAPTTPESTLELARISKGILPDGVFNVILGDGLTTGDALTKHPVPGLLSITGSVRAGRQVALAAAESLKRAHLELGGKAPAVVFEDADIAAAAEGIAIAGFFNAGQDCTAACRVLVHESVADKFVAALVAQAEQTVTGPQADAFYGPLNNAQHFAKVSSFIENLPAHAQIKAGGHRVGDKGFFYAPTVVTGVRQDDDLIQQEVFGPVITVQTFSDEAEAVKLANDVEYGLSSSVWTKDHSRTVRLSRDLDFGCVWINTHIPLVAEFPHGGFKNSGYGKDLSLYAIEDYTRVKHVMSAID